MMYCGACNKKYIGSTISKVTIRFLEHTNNISNPYFCNISNISKHFIDEYGSQIHDLKIIGIERIPNPPRGGDREAIMRDREAYWILTLNTIVPNGLNLKREIMLHYCYNASQCTQVTFVPVQMSQDFISYSYTVLF